MLLLPFLLTSVAYLARKYTKTMPEPLAYPQWLMFGDSITQQSFAPGGLGQALADDYQRRMDIVNRGYGGYNSLWGLEVVPHVCSFPASFCVCGD